MAQTYANIRRSLTALVLANFVSLSPALAYDDAAMEFSTPAERPVQVATLFAPKAMPSPPARPRPRKIIQLQQGLPMLAPFGHVRFCVHHPEECQPSAPATELLASVQTDAMELARQTNDRVNASIKAQADPDRPDGDVWTLGPLAGDCDDFAVTKRSLLIKAGMSSSNVLLAHVVTRQGEDHLVTVVRMNDGDFVLDNLDRTVRPVSETRYRWVSIQSSEDPRFWHRAELQARPLLLARF